MIDAGNSMADLRLRRDDVVYVPNGGERFVSVLGQVQHPGAVPLTSTSTLASVLAGAGGFTEPAGNKPHIQIVDPATGTSRTISMNDLLNPSKSLEIKPKPGEIIFVPQSGFFRATYVVERLSPVITAAALIGVGLPLTISTIYPVNRVQSIRALPVTPTYRPLQTLPAPCRQKAQSRRSSISISSAACNCTGG